MNKVVEIAEEITNKYHIRQVIVNDIEELKKVDVNSITTFNTHEGSFNHEGSFSLDPEYTEAVVNFLIDKFSDKVKNIEKHIHNTMCDYADDTY